MSWDDRNILKGTNCARSVTSFEISSAQSELRWLTLAVLFRAQHTWLVVYLLHAPAGNTSQYVAVRWQESGADWLSWLYVFYGCICDVISSHFKGMHLNAGANSMKRFKEEMTESKKENIQQGLAQKNNTDEKLKFTYQISPKVKFCLKNNRKRQQWI